MKKKRPTTDNRGASDERACIKRFIKKQQRLPRSDSAINALQDVINFINTRSKRFRARKGGL